VLLCPRSAKVENEFRQGSACRAERGSAVNRWRIGVLDEWTTLSRGSSPMFAPPRASGHVRHRAASDESSREATMQGNNQCPREDLCSLDSGERGSGMSVCIYRPNRHPHRRRVDSDRLLPAASLTPAINI